MKFRQSRKGLSPVVATLVLIAVTLTIAIIVAAWMSNLTIGLMGKAEQGSITNVALANFETPNTGGNATATVQNTGSNSITIVSGSIDGQQWNLTKTTISKGTEVTVVLSTHAGTPFDPVSSAQYTVKLMTTQGNTLVNTVTYVPP